MLYTPVELIYRYGVSQGTLVGSPFNRQEKMKRTFLILLGCWILANPESLLAQPSSRSLTQEAMTECHDGRIDRDRASRVGHFEKGQALAEQAVAVDDQSADAHFALFCNLGELMRIDGELTITSVMGFRRMTNELDRTLELAPDHLDALSAKGAFLLRLPSLLGGDREKGEKLLQYVLLKSPQSVNARLSLAKSYCADGRHREALSLAFEALDLIQTYRWDDFAPEAEKVLAQLHASATKAN
jgi:tetratricopeptide (TPR) repeat protein